MENPFFLQMALRPRSCLLILVEYEHPEHRAMAELHRYVVIVDGKTGEMKRRVSRQKIL